MKLILMILLFASYLSGNGEHYDIWLSDTVIIEETAASNGAFVESAGGRTLSELRKSYQNSFRKYFPNALTVISDDKLNGTFAVYASVTRASLYEVASHQSKLIYYALPVTATLHFINLATSEELYSQTYTYIGNFQTTTEDEKGLAKKLEDTYQKTYTLLFDYLSQKAFENFKPYQTSARVIGHKWDLVILDKGTESGIEKGDGLESSTASMIRIQYAAKNYSVAKCDLGEAREGDVFYKTYLQAIDTMDKPKIALLDIRKDTDKLSMSDDMFYQFFNDTFAQSGSFSLLSINKSFWKGLNSLQGSVNLPHRFSKRLCPDYFIRLYLDGPYHYDLSTTAKYITNRRYEMRICGEIVDTTARVVASQCHRESFDENITFGEGYDVQSQYEVVTKNAAISLAKILASSVSFAPYSYAISNTADDSIVINDPSNTLFLGETMEVFHDIGAMGEMDHLFIPIAIVKIMDKKNGTASARVVLKTYSEAPDIQLGDQIFHQGIVSQTPDTVSLQLCNGMNSNTITGFDDMVNFLIAGRVLYPFYHDNGLQDAVVKHLNTIEFDNVPNNIHATANYCIQPILKSGLKSSELNNGYLQEVYDFVVGTKIFRDTEVVAKYGVGGEKTFYFSDQESDSSRHLQLLDVSLHGFEDSLKKLNFRQ